MDLQWIIPLALIALGLGVLRANVRKNGFLGTDLFRDRRAKGGDLGTEATDFKTFDKVTAKLKRQNTLNRGHIRNMKMVRVPDQEPVAYDQQSDADNARKLVAGLSEMAPVTLFIDAPADRTSDNSRLLLDIMQTLNVPLKIVDVSSDSTMHLAFPRQDNRSILPQLYIDGLVFGGLKHTLDAIDTGSLIATLTAQKIPFDIDAAANIAQRPIA